jgi:hypothetical protein
MIRSTVLLAAVLNLAVLIATSAAQAPAGGESVSDDRVAFMRKTLEPIRLSSPAQRPPLRLNETPAFRLGKQGADVVEEGAIFFWVDELGRPEAAVQVFQVRDARAPRGIWIHEFMSLSPTPLSGEGDGARTWNSQSPGVTIRPLPGAPVLASRRDQRDRQMRALAREFRASDLFHEKSWTELRLLPTPIARYGKDGAEVVDGALFAFVTGTDPEAFLFLEARREAGKAEPSWHYAFAPMTCWELKGSHKGTEVWTSPLRKAAQDRTQPYYLYTLPELTPTR